MRPDWAAGQVQFAISLALASGARTKRLTRAGSRLSSSFWAVFQFVLRRAPLWRVTPTHATQSLHARLAKPEYSIEKCNYNGYKYNIVEHYNNSM
jgi:hypothetical protein